MPRPELFGHISALNIAQQAEVRQEIGKAIGEWLQAVKDHGENINVASPEEAIASLANWLTTSR